MNNQLKQDIINSFTNKLHLIPSLKDCHNNNEFKFDNTQLSLVLEKLEETLNEQLTSKDIKVN